MKKSEFYAAMCICIILCSLQTVFAVSYQPQIIQPTKPYQVCTMASSLAQNTYTTVVDISGKGILSKVQSYVSTVNNSLLTIKITVDGTAFEVKGPLTATQGITSAGQFVYVSSTSISGDHQLIYTGPLYFHTSLKIEVSQNNATARDVETTVNYATE